MQHFPRPTSRLNFPELARASENFRQQLLEAQPSFHNMISLHPMFDPWLDIHTAFYFLHSSLVDQLYVKGVRPNSIKYASNIHPKTFNSFYKTAIHEESLGIFTSPASNDVCLRFIVVLFHSVVSPVFFD